VHAFLHLLGPLLLAAAAGSSVRARLDGGLPDHAQGAERASWASSLLVGAPYRPSPLGEGSGFDPDPRFRLDAFDCVTFVETAMALGNAGTVSEAERLLDDVRYDGSPDYRHRNHYVESEWIPSLERKGWLEPVTRSIAGPLTVRTTKRLDAAAWELAGRSGHLVAGLSPADGPRGDFDLELVPLDRLLEVGPRIPDGTVLLVVREDRPNRPTRVTHMGLVVVLPDGSRAVRHASDVPRALRVRDEPLEAFARRASRQKWRIVGVSLYRIRDDPERAKQAAGGGTAPTGIKDSR